MMMMMVVPISGFNETSQPLFYPQVTTSSVLSDITTLMASSITLQSVPSALVSPSEGKPGLGQEVQFLCSSTNQQSSSSLTECINLYSALNESDLKGIYNLVRNHSFYTKADKFIPDRFVQLIWSVLFGLMILIAAAGNFSVFWIITGHRKMRTVTNMFLVNLTIADLIMALFNAVFNFVYLLHSHWPFGQTYCVLNNFLANVTVASSVFTIMATSIDR